MVKTPSFGDDHDKELPGNDESLETDPAMDNTSSVESPGEELAENNTPDFSELPDVDPVDDNDNDIPENYNAETNDFSALDDTSGDDFAPLEPEDPEETPEESTKEDNLVSEDNNAEDDGTQPFDVESDDLDPDTSESFTPAPVPTDDDVPESIQDSESDLDEINLDDYGITSSQNDPEWEDEAVRDQSFIPAYDPTDSVAEALNDSDVYDDDDYLVNYTPDDDDDETVVTEEEKKKSKWKPILVGMSILAILLIILGSYLLNSRDSDTNPSAGGPLTGTSSTAFDDDDLYGTTTQSLTTTTDANGNDITTTVSEFDTPPAEPGRPGAPAGNDDRIRDLESQLEQARRALDEAQRADGREPVIRTTTVTENNEPVTRTVPGPERVVTRTVPGPERVVTRAVPGPERVVTRTVPGPERVVTQTVPGDRVTVTRTVIERLR